VNPRRQVDAREDGVGGARQEWPHGLQQHRLQSFDLRRQGTAWTRRVVPGADDDGEALGVARDDLDPAQVGWFERFVRAHRCGCGPDEKANIAPVDLEVLETEQRSGRELARQVVAVEPDRRKGHTSLDAALQLQQFDLQVDGRREIGLLVLEPSELDNFPGFGAGLLSFGHGRIVTARSGCRVVGRAACRAVAGLPTR
jgi:hypothetical protein